MDVTETHGARIPIIGFGTMTLKEDLCVEMVEMCIRDRREGDIEIIKYASVRDPSHRLNIAILSCGAFASAEPMARQSWRVLLGSNGARALCEMPGEAMDFNRQAFQDDPRIAAMRWDR